MLRGGMDEPFGPLDLPKRLAFHPSRLWRGLLILGFFLGGCASAPPLMPILFNGFVGVPLNVHAVELKNGLRLIHEWLPGNGQVALVLTIRAGSGRDPKGQEGLAHLLEHLVYRGKDNAGATRWYQHERLGATRFNAFTTPDATIFVVEVPTQSIGGAMNLLADILAAPLRDVDDAAISTERAIVKNELLWRGETQIEGPLTTWSAQALFPEGHQLRQPVGGTTESLTGLVLQDLIHFGQNFYRLTMPASASSET